MKRNFTISIPYAFLWKVLLPLVFFIGAIGALLGIVVVDRLVMPTMVHANKGMVSVPEITGLAYEEARQRLYESGLYCDVASREFNQELPRDMVVSQDPAPGEEVKKGRLIAIVVSKGPMIGTLPSLRKLTERQARNEMRKQGFDIGKVRRVWDDQIEKDLVTRTEPEAGTTISREMAVDVCISNGPRPTHADVPSVVGDPIAAARTRIEEAGLVVGSVQTQHNSTVAPGTVLSQSAAPGTTVPLESAVDLVVSVVQR